MPKVPKYACRVDTDAIPLANSLRVHVTTEGGEITMWLSLPLLKAIYERAMNYDSSTSWIAFGVSENFDGVVVTQDHPGDDVHSVVRAIEKYIEETTESVGKH